MTTSERVGIEADLRTNEDFERLTAPLRTELLAHCYRMLGSLSDAEDQVQETYLRAWKAFHRFEGRSSARTWMHTIATNTCLTARSARTRRPLPTGLGAPAPSGSDLREQQDVPWLEPLPDRVLWEHPPEDPADRAVLREGVSLATVAALQELPPKQRAALILRDVLQLSAAETAAALDTSVPATNSALQRARARMVQVSPARRVEELDARDRETYATFLDAFDRYDVATVVSLLTDEATWEMPPFAAWFQGRSAIAALLEDRCPAQRPGDLRMVSTSANGQPAAGMYLRDVDGVLRPFQLTVLDIRDGAVRSVISFFDTSSFARAGLLAMLRS